VVVSGAEIPPPSAGYSAGVEFYDEQDNAGTYTGIRESSDYISERAAGEIAAFGNRARTLQRRINEYSVEWHKKGAIPAACIVFVLIGAPLAVRFPRGGAGMVILFSTMIFGIYYISLIGGESLGDAGTIAPFVGPWLPNLAFLVISAWGLSRIGRETSTTRGGGLDDFLQSTRDFFGRPFRRRRARPHPVGAD
jgi:lipopolysaccharide export system permease protein